MSPRPRQQQQQQQVQQQNNDEKKSDVQSTSRSTLLSTHDESESSTVTTVVLREIFSLKKGIISFVAKTKSIIEVSNFAFSLTASSFLSKQGAIRPINTSSKFILSEAQNIFLRICAATNCGGLLVEA